LYIYFSVERTKTVRRWPRWKITDATTFNWTTFNCCFKTSSDKLQNVGQSLNVSSLETVCLFTAEC